jgi:hypothetical protein
VDYRGDDGGNSSIRAGLPTSQPRLLKSSDENEDKEFHIEQLPIYPCAKSTLTHQLHGELKSTISTLPKFQPKRGIRKNFGFRINNPT